MRKKIILFILTISCFATAVQAGNWTHINKKVPTRTLKTGVDINGKALFLCRGAYKNSIQIGKTWQGYNHCNISYAGKELLLSNYKVFIKKDFQHFGWRKPFHGKKAIKVGTDTNGQALFVCKGAYRNSIQPGKTWAGYNKCNIAYAGHEVLLNNYQILVQLNNIQPLKPSVHPTKRRNYRCIKNFSNEICGYNCLQSGTSAACAQKPGQHCMADNFNNIACGYHCIASPFKVICSQRKKDNCVKNTFNELRCGRNCRINNFNQINCD